LKIIESDLALEDKVDVLTKLMIAESARTLEKKPETK